MPVINKYHHGGQVPPGAVNIMRGTIWGNPFVINFHGTRPEVIKMHKLWLFDKMKKEPRFCEQLKKLHEKTLCCCCAPAACHGDTLLAAAKWLHEGGKP